MFRDCKQTTEFLSQQIDGRIGLLKKLRIKMHLMFCSCCGQYDEQIALLRQASCLFLCDEHLESDDGAKLENDACNRLQQAIDRELNGQR